MWEGSFLAQFGEAETCAVSGDGCGGGGTPNPPILYFYLFMFSVRWLGSARCPAPHPEHEIQITWRAPVCCQVADFAGQPLSRHRAIGSWTKPSSRRRWAKLWRLPPDVRVSCQVVTIAPQWPRRLCGLSRHRAIGSWTNAWSRRGWAKLQWSHPDVRVACQVVAIAPQWPRRQCGRRVLSHGRRPGSGERTKPLSRRRRAKLRRSHPDVRVSCQVAAIAP